jgi:hypothetical protein
MSILYYILGIVFFIVIIAICVVNISNYIEILNVADEQGTGDTNTGLSYSWVQTLIILNVIVGVISLVLFSYCISVLFIGEPINKEPIDLTDSELGPYVLEQFLAKKYFEETKKRNPNALRDAGKAATQELALMLYKEGYTGYEANIQAKDFMSKFIKDKFPETYTVSEKFINNEEYETLLKDKNEIKSEIKNTEIEINKIVNELLEKSNKKYDLDTLIRKKDTIESINNDPTLSDDFKKKTIKIFENDMKISSNEINNIQNLVSTKKETLDLKKNVIGELNADIKFLENTKVIIGKPFDVILGSKESNIPWYKQLYSYLFEQPYDGLKIN